MLFGDHLGCSVEPVDFFMSSGAADAETVRSLLARQGISEKQVVIYANPCARWQTKFWSAEYWASLADLIFAQGKALVFAGSPADRKFIAQISSRMQSKPYIAAGDLGLTEAVALLKRSAAYVGLDSGPMHMAAMTQTPVVALFGPTHPERVGPYGVKHVVVRNEKLACLGCRKRQCDHLSCMQGISVDEVLNALTSLLPPLPG
jgi:ADP-heptose:LPS heptosyltransferase